MNVKSLFVVLGAVGVLSSLGAAPENRDSSYDVPRSLVLVMEAEVTVDGDPRPNLGRSFSDTISDGLLESRYFRVIDYLSNEEIAAEAAKSENLPPERNAVRFGRMAGADLVIIPRMVSEGYHHVMTIKEINVGTGEVVDIHRVSGEGGDSGIMFELCEQGLAEILAETRLTHSRQVSEARRRAKGPPTRPSIIDVSELEPPAPVIGQEKPIKEATPGLLPKPGVKAKGKVEVETGKKELGEDAARIAGRVTNIDSNWGFCVFTADRSAKVKLKDRLFVPVSDPLIGIAKLDVVKIEGRQVIADFSEDIDTSLVRTGTKVYFVD